MTAIRTICLATLLAMPLPGTPAALADECDDSPPQQVMNRCAYDDWVAADGELNAAYKKARAFLQDLDADLPAEQRGAADALRDAQRAWITYRDKACEAEAALFRGGTMEPFLYNSCRADLTRRRTKDLIGLVEVY